MAKGDVLSVEIEADGISANTPDGWYAAVTVEWPSADALPGSGDFALDPNGTPKVTFDVTSQGYTDKVLGTVSRSLIGTTVIRQPYPNDASLDVVDNGGDTLTLRIALSEDIYAGDTSITADFASGWVTGAGTTSSVSVTNNSVLTYPKPVGDFAIPGYQMITADTFTVEVYAEGRADVAGQHIDAVEIEVEDESANTATYTATVMELSDNPPNNTASGVYDGIEIPVYKMVIDATAFDDAEVLTVRLRVYPKVGNASAILDSDPGADGTAQPSSNFGNLYLVNNRAGGYGRAIAIVNSAGTVTDTSGIFTDEATAQAATPGASNAYATLDGALDAIKNYHNTNYSRDAIDGGIVLMTEAGASWNTNGVYGTINETWCTIKPKTGTTPTFTTSTSGASAGLFRVQNIAIDGSEIGFLEGRNDANSLLWIDDCPNFNLTRGFADVYKWRYMIVTNSTITAWGDSDGFSTNDMGFRLWRGNYFANDHPILGTVFLGNSGKWRIRAHDGNAGPVADQLIVANGYSTVEGGERFITNALSGATIGVALSNLVLERTDQVSGSALLFLFGDGDTNTYGSMSIRHLSIAGQRTNFAYNDVGTAAVLRPHTYVHYVYADDFNSKSDMFNHPADGRSGNRIGNWPVMFGVNFRGWHEQYYQGGVGDSGFELEFYGLDFTSGDPLVTDDASFYGDDTGGGDYTPDTGSPLLDRHGAQILPFDLYGAERSANANEQVAGAVVPGSAELAVPYVGTEAELFAPVLAFEIIAPLLGGSVSVYAPASLVTLISERIEPATQTYAPSVIFGVSAPFRESAAAVFTPAVPAGGVLASFIASAAQVTGPDAFYIAGPSGFTRLAYQRDPFRVLWAVRADGVLCGLTYRRDQDVWAWHRHPAAGRVRDIAVIPHPEGAADEVWLLVERIIDGQTKRFIEYMDQPHEPQTPDDQASFLYLDSALTYEGTPATVFSGLGHLDGETVSILADGAVVADQTVTDGQVTLSEPATIVHVGLSYTSLVETLGVDPGARDGTAHGRSKAITEARILVSDTIGGTAGRSLEALDPLLDRDAGDLLDGPPRLFTGYHAIHLNTGWDQGGRMLIVQDQPYPMTILAIVPVTTAPGR